MTVFSHKRLKIRLFLLLKTLAKLFFMYYNNGVSGVIFSEGDHYGFLSQKN